MSLQLNSSDASIDAQQPFAWRYHMVKLEAALFGTKKQWVDTSYSVSVVQGKHAEIAIVPVSHALLLVDLMSPAMRR